MIDRIIVGSGNKRTSIDMVRDKGQRKSAARALIGHLFPTQGSYHKALREGKKRAQDYLDGLRSERRAFA